MFAHDATSKIENDKAEMPYGSRGRPSNASKQLHYTNIVLLEKLILDILKCTKKKSCKKHWQSYLCTSKKQYKTCHVNAECLSASVTCLFGMKNYTAIH